MNGSEALEFLSTSDTLPDVILLDVMMPDMSGYEVNRVSGTEGGRWGMWEERGLSAPLFRVLTPRPSPGWHAVPQVCQEIRKRYSSVSIPIIMVSAKGNPEHIMKGLEAGSVDYVKKPFHRQELLSRVRAQVRNRCGARK